MEDHYRKKHKENFTWIKCKLGRSERREEMVKYQIKWHNIYSKNEYYTKPEKLEDLLNPEHYDVILVTLEELVEKRKETNREILKSMDSRPRLFWKIPIFRRYYWISMMTREVWEVAKETDNDENGPLQHKSYTNWASLLKNCGKLFPSRLTAVIYIEEK